MLSEKPILLLRVTAIAFCIFLMMQQAFAAPFSINGADVIPVVETPEEVRSNLIAPVVSEALEESFYTIPSASTWRSIYYNGSQTPAHYSYPLLSFFEN